MKRSLLAAAALLMLSTAAYGKSTVLHRSGGWTADGDEEPWVASMTGSRAVAATFKRCAAYIDAQSGPTQPTGKPAPTQPYGKPAPTQPFGKATPASPARRDNGSI